MLALTLPTRVGRSVGIVGSRTQVKEFVFEVMETQYNNMNIVIDSVRVL
jgi:hypothetical protein